MNRKKICSPVLPVALAFTLSLTACGGTSSDTPTNASAGDAGESTSVADTAAAPAGADAADASGAGEASEADAPGEAAPAGPEAGAEVPPAPVENAAPPAAQTKPEEPAETGSTPPPEPPAKPAATEAPAASEAPEPLSLAGIREKMVTDLGISDYMELSADRLLDLYGIQEADYVQSGSFATMSGAFPGEVILLEAADDAAAKRIAEHLQTRLDEVLNQYKTYDAATYALAEACTIDTDGRVVSMLLSPEREDLRKLLTECLS